MATKTASKKGIVKKAWKQILAPAMFGEQVIGDIYIGDVNTAVGRQVTVSMANLTGEYQKQNMHLTFLITGAKDGKLTTGIIGYKISPFAVKKMTRRKRSKIDISFPAKTSDGKNFRVKLIAVTRNRAKGSAAAALCNSLKLNTITEIAKLTYDEFFNEVLKHKLQKDLQGSVKKIYPVAACELRYVKYVPTKKEKEQLLSAEPAKEAAEAQA